MRLWLTLLILLATAGFALAWQPPYDDVRGRFGLPLYGLSPAIDCRDGQEIFTLPVAMPADEGVGWIFEIPAEARDVHLAFRHGLTFYSGTWSTQTFTERLKHLREMAMLTQLYPFVWEIFRPSLSRTQTLPNFRESPVVRDHGLCARLVDARNQGQLAQAAARDGLNLDPLELQPFSRFADGKHVFVILSIESRKAYASDHPTPDPMTREISDVPASLEIRFPSQQPLMPAALRWHAEIASDFDVVVRGYYRPELPIPDLRAHEFLGQISVPADPSVLPYGRARLVESQVPYTRLQYFTEQPQELRFQPDRRISLALADTVVESTSGWLATVLLLIVGIAVLSYLSAGLAGLLVFRRWKGFARAGLWNFTTLFGLRFRLELGINGIDTVPRATPFVLCFTGIFMLLCYLVTILPAVLLGGQPT